MTTTPITNTDLRKRARDVVSLHWGQMLGMLLIIFAITFAVTLVLEAFILTIAAANEPLYAGLSLVSSIVTSAFTSALTLGHLAAMMRLEDDLPIRVTDVFSLMHKWLPAWGLGLWIGLKTFLWMLPGIAVIVIGFIAAVNSPAATSLVAIIGYIVMIVPAIRAMYSYTMATYIMADNPDVGVFNAVNQSKAMMTGRRWELFKLLVPYLLIILAAILVLALLIILTDANPFVTIIGVVALIVLTIRVAMQAGMAQLCFYKAYK